MGIEAFVYVLVAVVVSHGHIIKEHVAVYGKEDTCQGARRAIQYYSTDQTYFCQKELVK